MKRRLPLSPLSMSASEGCKAPATRPGLRTVTGGLHPLLARLPPCWALLLLGLPLIVLTARAVAHEPPRADEAGQRAQREQLRKMTQAEREEFFRSKSQRELADLIGPPQRIARQLFYQGRLEQWVYDDLCRVEFLCPLGKEAQFQGVHSLSRR